MPLGRNTRNFLRACRSSFLRRAEGGAASEASKPPEARGGGCRVDLVKSASKGGGKCWIRIKRYKKSTIIVAKATTRRKIEPSTKCATYTHNTDNAKERVCRNKKNRLSHATAVVVLRALCIYIHISIRVDRATVQLYAFKSRFSFLLFVHANSDLCRAARSSALVIVVNDRARNPFTNCLPAVLC